MNKLTYLLAFLTLAISAQAQNPLLIPDTLSGTQITLNLQNGSVNFYSGQSTGTMGVNGNILGPTLLLQQGDSVNFTVNNQLGDTTTIHWHGMHVSADNDGGPHTPIAPNSQWTPGFTIRDKAACYWYHPHLHHLTDKHVSKGIAGLIIVRDQEEAALTLPRHYGVDDFPLVVQTKDFDSNGQIVVHSNADDVVMVNATIDPYLNVPAQVVRFRLLNGSSQRVFNIGLSNNGSFYQIASDGGLLSAPLSMSRLMLAPGERAEILVDLSGMNGQTLYLKSYASELPNGIYGATNPGMNASMTLNNYNPNPLNGTNFNLLKLLVNPATTHAVTSIPASLVSLNPPAASSANISRTLTFSPATPGMNQLNGNFLINGQSMDLNVINYTIPFNNTEIWELKNQSAISHPFHIHDVQFYILSRNGNAPAANEQGRKDVVLVKPMETVRFITRFETFANSSVPYMYHCHMLTHEDGGMMGQFVVSTNTTVQEADPNSNLRIYPNPGSGLFHLSIKGGIRIADMALYDMLGRRQQLKDQNSTSLLDLRHLSNGLYYLHLSLADGQSLRAKIILRH